MSTFGMFMEMLGEIAYNTVYADEIKEKEERERIRRDSLTSSERLREDRANWNRNDCLSSRIR